MDKLIWDIKNNDCHNLIPVYAPFLNYDYPAIKWNTVVALCNFVKNLRAATYSLMQLNLKIILC